MSKKQDSFYFDNFIACAEQSCQAANLLKTTMEQFHPTELKLRLDDMHAVEHAADEKKHELLHVLVKAFITPIEREDILSLSQTLDELTDKIEDVLLRIYCNNIQTIQPEAIEFASVIVKCCQEVKGMMTEFADFRHSKKLHEHIIRINTMEEEADRLFISSLRNLHTTCTDPITILTWREIYIYLEHCADACEHIADAVESVIMKNS